MAWNDPASRQTGDLITAAIWNEDVVDNLQNLYDNHPQAAVIFFLDANWEQVAGTGSMTVLFTSAQRFGFIDTWVGNGESYQSAVNLADGTYDIAVFGEKDSNRATVDWYLDGVQVASGQDWYAASTTKNVRQAVSGVAVSGSGRHLLKVTINGKHASSSNYYMGLTYVAIYPAAGYTQGV